MYDWILANKYEIGYIAFGVLSGALVSLRYIAPLTDTKYDDKALKWGERLRRAIGKYFEPKQED